MTAMPWVKLYSEILDDPKLINLTDQAKWRFIELILLASEHGNDGQTGMREKELAWRLRVDRGTLEEDLRQLHIAGLIKLGPDGVMVTAFSKRQGRPIAERRESDRERQQRHREKEQSQVGVTNVTRDINSAVTTVTNDINTCHASRVEESRVEESRVDVTRDNIDLSKFSTAFTNRTKIPEYTGGPRWPQSLLKIAESGATVEDMLAAIGELQAKDYQIAGPWSVINPTIMQMSKRLGKKPKKGKEPPRDADIEYLRLNPKADPAQRGAAIQRLVKKNVPLQAFRQFLLPVEVIGTPTGEVLEIKVSV